MRYCKSYGAAMFLPQNSGENAFLASFKRTKWLAMKKTDGIFVNAVTGDPVVYTNWKDGEPSSDNLTCVYMDLQGFWVGADCSDDFSFTCTIPIATSYLLCWCICVHSTSREIFSSSSMLSVHLLPPAASSSVQERTASSPSAASELGRSFALVGVSSLTARTARPSAHQAEPALPRPQGTGSPHRQRPSLAV
ncbi:receptor for egg jelly 2 protein precursor [Penaeus vannamei]|uniref:Receptor for egg jelly 2 protein n=1 Tax=Penaeus vannamei TaxID=6689 RepID=A0A3R7LYR0_PENVA|nr:receptor for egg jelly 2 protein precursor [Penaeus vannamei]